MAEVNYRVEANHTKKLYRDFVKFTYNVKNPGTGFRIFLFGVCFLTLAYMLENNLQYVALVLGVVLVGFALGRSTIATRRLVRSSENYGKTVIFEFSRETFVVKDARQELTCTYKQINPAYEDKAYYYLGIDNEVMHLIPKQDFKTGDPEAFKKFLEYTWKIELLPPKKTFIDKYKENLQNIRQQMKGKAK